MRLVLICINLVFLIFNARGAEYVWELERIDSPPTFGDLGYRYIQVDDQGIPYFVYGGDALYLTSIADDSCATMVVDSTPGCGRWASLGFDENHYAHIVYKAPISNSILYTCRNDTGWNRETIFSSPGTLMSDFDFSFTLDTQGRPHIIYQEDPSGSIIYACRREGYWYYETVVPGGYWSIFHDIVADDLDRIHAVFNSNGLFYGIRDDEGWRFSCIDSSVSYSTDVSIATDSMGSPAVVYDTGFEIRFARSVEDEWISEKILNLRCERIALAIDQDDLPHVSLTTSHPAYDIVYVHNSGGSWHTEVIDTEDGVFIDVAMDLDPDGVPHIACYDPYTSDLLYWVRGALQWTVSTVAHSYYVGQYSDLEVKSNGQCVVGHIDQGPNGEIRYTFEEEGAWRTEIVCSEYRPKGVSLALDSYDLPGLSFIDDSPGYLKFARHDGETWNIEIVDSGTVRWSTSLLIDESDNPIIAYSKTSARPLVMCANKTSDGWVLETVDTGNWYGGGGHCLIRDGSGRIHLSYTIDGSLRYAVRETDGWHVQALCDGAYDYCPTSLVLDRFGNPHIATNQNTGGYVYGRLQYAFRNAEGWNISFIPEAGAMCEQTSLLISETNTPFIAYGDFENGSLSMIWWDGDEWQWGIIDTLAYSGMYPSLKKKDDQFVVSYFNWLYGDLLLARSLGLDIPEARYRTHPENLSVLPVSSCGGDMRFVLFSPVPRDVCLDVYKLSGARVVRLIDRCIPPGRSVLKWNGYDDRGCRVPDGSYICSVRSGTQRLSERFVIIR